MKEEYEEVNVLELGLSMLDPGIGVCQPLEEGTIEEKCRACTRRLPNVKYNILETPGLLELFIRLSTTQLDPDDLLPKSICPQCFQRLQEVDNFQKTCSESYTLLLEHIANNLKQDSSDPGGLPINPFDDSASNPPRLLEFEEVVVPEIKSEDIKSEYQICFDSEDETEKIIGNQKRNLFGEIDLSPKKMNARQSLRKKGTKTRKSADERKVVNEEESTLLQTAIYTCESCGDRFDSEIHYKAHLRKHEGKKPYPCQQCPREYVSISLLEKHIHIEHSTNLPPKYECTVDGCDKKFRSQHALTNHQLKSHSNLQLPRKKKKTLICETCGKCISQAGSREHELMHKGLNPYSCDLCEKKFRSSIRLERHKLSHSDIKPHSCPICGIKMRSKKDINGHMNVHTHEKTFPCKHCGTNFSRKVSLTQHIRTVHYRIKEFHCTYCDQSFGQSVTLRRHLMLHTGERPHKCPYCEKRFIQKSKMEDHAKLHEEKGDLPVENTSTVDENTSTEIIKNFECEECGLKTTYMELKRHMAVHKRTCKMCNTVFTSGRALQNHVKVIHEGVKLDDYSCQYCDKKFGKATTLRDHTMRHTGERPLQCPHCEKRFISRAALHYHEKKREQNIAEGKIPCSKTGPGADSKAKRKRKRKSSSKIMILTMPTSEADIPQTDRQQATSFSQDETMLV